MANRKGKIIVGTGLVILAGVTTLLIVSEVRKKKILDRIYAKLDDTTLQGAGKTVGADEAHKFTLGLDPSFWKKKSGSPLPTKLISDKEARGYAQYLNFLINMGGLTEDESKILNVVKQAKTQGQLSQVAYMYSASPQNFGNLGDDLQDSLAGGFFAKDRLKELNIIINSLPY